MSSNGSVVENVDRPSFSMPSSPVLSINSAPELEYALLSAILVDPVQGSRVFAWFSPDSCVVPQCRVVAMVMSEIVTAGAMPDIITVYDRLVATNRAAEAGGWDFLTHLIHFGSSPMYIDPYARTIQNYAWRRMVASMGRKIAMWAEDLHIGTTDLLTRITTEIQKVRQAPMSPTQSLQDIVDHALEGLINPTAAHILPTGIPSLDARIGGMRPGDMVIVAARPGVGKSSFAASVAINVARTGGMVMVFSLEMSASLVATRMLATLSGVDLTRSPHSPRDRSALTEAAGTLRSLPIVIDDTPALTVADLRARVLSAPNGTPSLVIVDYLQLLTMEADGMLDRNPVQEVTAISRSLTDLARECDIPVLALSQLSRDSEKRQDTTPRLSDLRSSGALEQDAGLVLFLHPTAQRTPEGTVPIDVIIGKHRHGPIGVVSMDFVPSCFRFVDRPSSPEPSVRGGSRNPM